MDRDGIFEGGRRNRRAGDGARAAAARAPKRCARSLPPSPASARPRPRGSPRPLPRAPHPARREMRARASASQAAGGGGRSGGARAGEEEGQTERGEREGACALVCRDQTRCVRGGARAWRGNRTQSPRSARSDPPDSRGTGRRGRLTSRWRSRDYREGGGGEGGQGLVALLSPRRLVFLCVLRGGGKRGDARGERGGDRSKGSCASSKDCGRGFGGAAG